MSDNKTYRIKANVGNDSVLNVNLNQDYKTFELLSLKIESDNLYRFHTSNYGCVAGRVLANGNFGIPNAKISIFIKATDEDLSDAIISYLYPYKNTRMKNDDGIRYNLLPDSQLSDCHRNVGTFPNKRLVLDDNNVFEVYDKYYKYTTRSNEAGDYMIFGVPVGEQTIHVDIDLSDIGMLSQRPRDMVYKGYNATQFENANMFKSDTDLDTLTQIITQNSNVYVYPFWGEKSEGDIAITRKDIEIQYKFEPTCVFMGSIITDEKSNAISKTCIPSERMGKMDRLTTGNGTIEMIRKTPDGNIEEFIVQGNQLIDGNGVWCYQIPMNLDYVCTDEYGNIIPTDDPNKGIPTRTRVRFRMSITDFESNGEFSHVAKTLVPNNPKAEEDIDYAFGSDTKDDEFGTKSFRDLFWNEVYSVKSYIPRFQQGNYNKNKRFSGIKEVNVNGGNNPLPYNNMRVDISFMFGLQCSIFHVLLKIVTFFNKFVRALEDVQICSKEKYRNNATCLFIGDGYCPELQGWYFAPGCSYMGNTFDKIRQSGMFEEDDKSIEHENTEGEEKKCLTNNISYFVQCTEINMAMEYDVIQFDFYNDWVNGAIYSPRWNADIRKKRTYLFGLIRVSPRLNACSEENFLNTRRFVQQCAMYYKLDSGGTGHYTENNTRLGCASDNRQRCHKAKGRKYIRIFGNKGGVVHREGSLSGKDVYYYKPCEWQELPEGNGAYRKKRVAFFATDIILLGSLNDVDGQGIPQSFRNLYSSTYQLPDALASTNIGIEGYLYGRCTNDHNFDTDGVSIAKVEGNFENLEKWSGSPTNVTVGRGGNADDYDGYPYDADEKPITEASGIDWGFTGPRQESNNLSTLYFPGGHFLGISCANAETNIKSCVNLSRICELGSSISHRQSYVTKNGDDYEYVYSIPTGLISGDEILDNSGKSEFATLNQNNLRTKYNTENGLLEYDFKMIYSINFNGELSSKTATQSGKYGYYATYDDGSFKRLIEVASKDYYEFRMGLEGNDVDKELAKFLIVEQESGVSMPQYENSFYFYFGLRDGDTALDKFYKNFFAECPALNPYEPSVKITTENADICTGIGKIIIEVKNIDGAKCLISENGGKTWEEQPEIQSSRLTITGRTNVEYIVKVYGDNTNAVEQKVIIESEGPKNIIKYDVTNFTYGVPRRLSRDTDEGKIIAYFSPDTAVTGYLSISSYDERVRDILISDQGKLCYYFIKNDSGFNNIPKELQENEEIAEIRYLPSQVIADGKYYLWYGKETYNIYVRMDCGDNNITPWFKYDSFFVEMPDAYYISFGRSGTAEEANSFTIRSYLNQTESSSNLADGIINSTVSTKIRGKIMRSMFFEKSKYSIDNSHNMEVNYENDWNDEKIKTYGNEETINNEWNGSANTISLSERKKIERSELSNIYLPSKFMPVYTEYLINEVGSYVGTPMFRNNYRVIGNKEPYGFSDGGFINFTMNILYLPFYFKALLIDNKLSLAVANAIKYRNNTKLYYVKVNNSTITNNITYSEYYTLSELDTKYPMFSKSFCIEDMYQIDTTKDAGGITNVVSTSPSVAVPRTIEIRDDADRVISKMITPEFLNTGTTRFTSSAYTYIRYYVVEKSFLDDNIFDSYYVVPSGGSITKETYYPTGKKIFSNKIKNYFYNEERDSVSYNYKNPYFPSWDIGFGTSENSANMEHGVDYDLWNNWPKGNIIENKTRRFWSTAYIEYEAIITEDNGVNGIHSLQWDDNIANNKDNYYVIGVFDEKYHNSNAAAIFDEHSSSIIVVVKYTIDEFDEIRRVVR